MPKLKIASLPWLWYGIACVVIVFDQITKYAASHSLALYDIVTITSFFDITLRHNSGAAFSFLANAGGWQRWFLGAVATIVSLVLVVWIARLERSRKVELCGLALILGGAIGNLYDRLTLGYVVDFILVHWQRTEFPAFNIADSAISIGAGLLILDALLLEPKRRKHGNASTNETS